MNTKNKTIVAIDIAKSSLQVQIENSSFAISNGSNGFQRLDARISKLQEPFVVCEASGGYERKLVRHHFDQGVPVSVCNPARTRAFAISEGGHCKTDPVDAKMLQKFGQTKDLRPSPRPDPDIEKLGALLDRRAHLSETLTREKNRREKEPPHIGDLIESSIKFLEGQLEEVDQRIEEIRCSNNTMAGLVNRMTEIKGVGKTTAYTVLAYLPSLETISRGKMVSLAGLAPFNKESGKTKAKAFIH